MMIIRIFVVMRYNRLQSRQRYKHKIRSPQRKNRKRRKKKMGRKRRRILQYHHFFHWYTLMMPLL